MDSQQSITRAPSMPSTRHEDDKRNNTGNKNNANNSMTASPSASSDEALRFEEYCKEYLPEFWDPSLMTATESYPSDEDAMGSTPSLGSLSAFPEFEVPAPEYDKRLNYDMNTGIAAPSTSHSQLDNNKLVSENTPVAHLRQGQQTETYSETLQHGQDMIPVKSTATPQHRMEPQVTISRDIRQGQERTPFDFVETSQRSTEFNMSNPAQYGNGFNDMGNGNFRASMDLAAYHLSQPLPQQLIAQKFSRKRGGHEDHRGEMSNKKGQATNTNGMGSEATKNAEDSQSQLQGTAGSVVQENAVEIQQWAGFEVVTADEFLRCCKEQDAKGQYLVMDEGEPYLVQAAPSQPRVQKGSKKRLREGEPEGENGCKKARIGTNSTNASSNQPSDNEESVDDDAAYKPPPRRQIAGYKKRTRKPKTVNNGYRTDPESYTHRDNTPTAKYWSEKRNPRFGLVFDAPEDNMQLPSPIPHDYLRPDLPPYGMGEKYGVAAYVQAHRSAPPSTDLECRLLLEIVGVAGQRDYLLWAMATKNRDDLLDDWHEENAMRAERDRKKLPNMPPLKSKR